MNHRLAAVQKHFRIHNEERQTQFDRDALAVLEEMTPALVHALGKFQIAGRCGP
jgi:hypothetical protein